MQGKATLILTDKDTGRVVEQIEEHNMVTNALNRIFDLPPTLFYSGDTRDFFRGYLPMYTNLLKGIVLFEENVPELADNFMIGEKYNILATAGDEYAGADAMRGSFNANQSCEIENGYRFVWDFAPEKAVGTIKCLALTHRLMGNRGDLRLEGSQSYFLISSTDVSNMSYNSNVIILQAYGKTFLQRDNSFYSYDYEYGGIKILKYRISNPLAMKICDKDSLVVESETLIKTNLNISSTTPYFFDPATQKLYIWDLNWTTIDNASHYQFRYAIINPFTCENEYESDWITAEATFKSTLYRPAIYGEKIYFCETDNIICVCSLSGKIERKIHTNIAKFYEFCIFEGKVAAECRVASNGRRCIYVFDDPKNLMHQPEDAYRIVDSNEIHYPYCYADYANLLCIMFRTDYLATINNLSTPLEKTDRHALQIRYEITN